MNETDAVAISQEEASMLEAEEDVLKLVELLELAI